MADGHEAYLGRGDGGTVGMVVVLELNRDTLRPSFRSFLVTPWTSALDHVPHRRHYPVPLRS